MRGDESVHEAISAELEHSGNGTSFTVVEFGVGGGSVWTVARDQNGTPEARRRVLPNPPGDGMDDFYAREVRPLLGDRLALVACTTSDHPAGLLALLRDRHSAAAFDCQTPLPELLRQAIMLCPLTVPYELVVLQPESADGTGEPRLIRRSRLLFPKQARSGYHKEIPVRIAPADEHGTVFAIVTRIPVSGGKPSDSQFRQIEIQSGSVPPGAYRLTAWLMRPGHTQFELAGTPLQLSKEKRSWQQISGTIPERLAVPDPVHLICAIEISGGAERLIQRVRRLEEIISAADTGGRPLKTSVVAYGPHAVEPTATEEPATTLAWAKTPDQAIRELRGLLSRSPQEHEYPRAAQLECALHEIAAKLTPGDKRTELVTVRRTALVTAGSRPPHPPAVDLRTEIIPCRLRLNWRSELHELTRRAAGLRFGALCDTDAIGEIWRHLGQDAIGEVKAVEAAAFVERLGLREPSHAIPFPLIRQRGT